MRGYIEVICAWRGKPFIPYLDMLPSRLSTIFCSILVLKFEIIRITEEPLIDGKLFEHAYCDKLRRLANEKNSRTIPEIQSKN